MLSGEWFLPSDVAYRDHSYFLMYECICSSPSRRSLQEFSEYLYTVKSRFDRAHGVL